MTVSLETLIDRSVKRIGEVHPTLREYTIELITRCYKEAIFVQISSGYRSEVEQAHIYGQGRPSYIWDGRKYGSKGAIVSNAKPGTSIHNYGLAIDYFIVSDDGRKPLWVVNEKWRRVAEIAKSMGFEWGGDWSRFRDYPHLQLNKGLTINQLRAGKRPALSPLKKEASKSMVDYFKLGDKGSDITQLQTNLNKVGYVVLIDGSFGPGTDSVVRKFQSDNGLTVDGYFGPSSKAKLSELLSVDKDKYRLVTGTFIGKAEAEKQAEQLRKDRGWLVYVQKA